MTKKQIFHNLVIAGLGSLIGGVSFTPAVIAQESTWKNQYTCEITNGVPTTYVRTERGKIKLIEWQNTWASASGYPPEVRCDIVTERFQRSSDAQQLKHITTNYINNYPVICIGELIANNKYKCINDDVLITLQQGENAPKVLREIFYDAIVEGVTATRGTTVINMEKILETAEVIPETSQQSPTSVPTNTESVVSPPSNTNNTGTSMPTSSEGSEGITLPDNF